MAILTLFPTGSSGSWTSNENAFNKDDGLYATSSPSRNGSVYTDYYGFNFSTLPLGVTLNSITVYQSWKVSVTSSIATLMSQVYYGSVARGTAFNNTAEPLNLTTDSYNTVGTWTVAELKESSTSFTVRVTSKRGAISTAFTASLDAVWVVIDYTPITYSIDISCPDGHGTSNMGLGVFTVNQGDAINIIPQPSSGTYILDHMTVNGVSYSVKYTGTATQNLTVVLYFKVDIYVTGVPSTGGVINIDKVMNHVIPYTSYYHDVRIQYIILASELLGCGLSAGNIAFLSTKPKTTIAKQVVNQRIRLKNTSAISLTAWDNDNLTLVYEGNIPFPIELDTDGFVANQYFSVPFAWDGVSNLLVDLSKDDLEYVGSAVVAVTQTYDYTNGNRIIGHSADSTSAYPFTNATLTLTSSDQLFVTKIKVEVTQSAVPTVTVVSQTRTEVSEVSGVDISTVVFKCDKDILEWESRADGAGVGQGLLVGSGGAVTANTEISFEVDHAELTNGDKDYKVNIYARNSEGWSAYE